MVINLAQVRRRFHVTVANLSVRATQMEKTATNGPRLCPKKASNLQLGRLGRNYARMLCILVGHSISSCKYENRVTVSAWGNCSGTFSLPRTPPESPNDRGVVE